jgi:hypothetical protein
VPPAGQHADEAEARDDVPVLAAGLADVRVADAHPFVLARLEEHPLDQDALGGLALALAGGPLAHVGHAAGEVVADALELAEAEQARPRDAHTGRAGRQSRGDQRGRMLTFEVCDLVAERAPGGAFVDLLPERRLEHEAPPCGAANVPPVSILPNP